VRANITFDSSLSLLSQSAIECSSLALPI